LVQIALFEKDQLSNETTHRIPQKGGKEIHPKIGVDQGGEQAGGKSNGTNMALTKNPGTANLLRVEKKRKNRAQRRGLVDRAHKDRKSFFRAFGHKKAARGVVGPAGCNTGDYPDFPPRGPKKNGLGAREVFVACQHVQCRQWRPARVNEAKIVIGYKKEDKGKRYLNLAREEKGWKSVKEKSSGIKKNNVGGGRRWFGEG